jgi:hypothetical protein
MESKIQVPYSEEPATGPYPETAAPSPYFPTLFP